MKNNYSIAERNRIVEENLHWIDKTIRRNTGLMRAVHLDYPGHKRQNLFRAEQAQ